MKELFLSSICQSRASLSFPPVASQYPDQSRSRHITMSPWPRRMLTSLNELLTERTRTSSEFVAKAMREELGVRYWRSMISSWWPEMRRVIGRLAGIEVGSFKLWVRRVWSLWTDIKELREGLYLGLLAKCESLRVRYYKQNVYNSFGVPHFFVPVSDLGNFFPTR